MFAADAAIILKGPSWPESLDYTSVIQKWHQREAALWLLWRWGTPRSSNAARPNCLRSNLSAVFWLDVLWVRRTSFSRVLQKFFTMTLFYYNWSFTSLRLPFVIVIVFFKRARQWRGGKASCLTYWRAPVWFPVVVDCSGFMKLAC